MKSFWRPVRQEGGVLLFLPWEFDLLGGVDVVADRLWGGLEKQAPGRDWFGIQDWTLAGERSDDCGRRFLHLNFPAPAGAGGGLSARYLATLLRRAPVMLRELREHDIRLINFHFPTLNVYPLALLKKLGLWRGRIVLSFHGSDVKDVDPAAPGWHLIAETCDAVTACSGAMAARVKALGLFEPERIEVVYNGIDGEAFRSMADEGQPGLPDRFILNVGNYVPGKAQDVLLEAFARIAQDFPDLGLVFAGGTDRGEWLAGLREQAIRHGVSGRVHFLENLAQARIAALMREATCLAHSSLQEAFGLVVIEAGASRLPVVASRVGGIPEIIESGRDGLLVDVGDVGGFATALADVLAAPEAARARADSLYARVEDRFSVVSMVRGYTSVYARLLE